MIDGDDDASADNMGTCADCVDPDARECVEFPNFKTLTQDHFSLIIGKGSHETLSFRSCTYTCGSTGSWCAVTGNHLYDQRIVWIWSVRRGMSLKLELSLKLGVTDQALNWFTSYLFDRAQRVAVNGGLSDAFRSRKGCRKSLVLARFC